MVKKIIKGFKKPLVYDMHLEYKDTNAMIYKPTDYSNKTLDNFCLRVKALALKGKVDCLVIEETDMYFSSNYDILPNLNDLVINHRHYGLALVFVSRRLQDVPQKIVEQCHALFIFMLEGVGATDKLRRLHADFEIQLSKLSLERHNYIIKEVGQAPYLCSPVSP